MQSKTKRNKKMASMDGCGAMFVLLWRKWAMLEVGTFIRDGAFVRLNGILPWQPRIKDR